jgi:hypothetical protein
MKKQIPKKRPPIEQLRKAGEEARQMLIKKGLISPENLVETTAKEFPNLILPGIPAYLPYKWTIKDAQRIMYDIFKMWQFYNSKKNKKESHVENLALFITFCLKEMKHQEAVAKQKMDSTHATLHYLKKIPVIGKIFEPVNQYNTIKGISIFFVDSFAVGIIVNGKASTTSEFADFFFEWTNKLYAIWEKKDEKAKVS